MRLTLSDPAAARKISFGWTLERGAGWRVTEPVRARAADSKVDALVQALGRSRALAVAPSSADFSGGVTLALDDRPQARIADDKVHRADDALLLFRKTDLNLLFAPATVFYERRLFPLRLDESGGRRSRPAQAAPARRCLAHRRPARRRRPGAR